LNYTAGKTSGNYVLRNVIKSQPNPEFYPVKNITRYFTANEGCCKIIIMFSNQAITGSEAYID